jgi:GNAT superfamily N-acetyltransferase
LKRTPDSLRFEPAGPASWGDLETLFGERGACGGCWCMWWRLPRVQYDEAKGAKNKRAFKALVAKGEVPGIVAYDGDVPVGWCAVAPRESYPRLARSRTLKPVDDRPVWSVTCFFVLRDWRRRGVSVRLLEAASRFVASRGGRIVEGYPVEPRAGAMPDAFAWTGLAETFRRAGFREVARPSPTRPIMRRELT